MHALHYAYSMMQCINTPAPELRCEIRAGTFGKLNCGCRHRGRRERVGIVDVEMMWRDSMTYDGDKTGWRTGRVELKYSKVVEKDRERLGEDHEGLVVS